MAFASLTIDLNARIANIERDMGRAAHVAETQAKRMEGAFAKAGLAMSTIGGALAGAGLLTFAKSGLDAADALNDMSIRLGVTVKDLASMQLVAEQSGTSLEGIGVGIAKLNKSASEAAGGNDKLAKTLSDLGVTASTPLERFYQLADAVQGMADPTQHAAELSAILGKNYLDLVPTLVQGSTALRESAAASAGFADAMARLAPDADKFNDQLAQLKINAAGASASILAQMVPSLNEYIAVMREVINTGSVLDKVRFFALGNASDEIVNRVRNASSAMSAASEMARKAAGSGNNAAQLECIASGGTWTGTTCTPKRSSGGRRSSGAAKLDTIDPFGKERIAAEKAALKSLTDAQNAAYDDLSESRDYAIQQDEQAAANMGRLREATIALIDPIQQYRDKLDEVQILLDKGLLTPDQAVAANLYWQEQIEGAAGFGEQLKKTKDEFDLFAEEALKGFQDGLADFLFDPFAEGLDGMAKGFGNLIQKMLAEAIAADITRALFGSTSGGSGGGQNILGSIAELFGFASGGSFTVGGGGGTDSQLVAFKATPGEDVTIRTPAQQRAGSSGGGIHINMVVNATDAGSVRASMGQIKTDLARAVGSARRNL
ncbi:MAG: hypothetical protein WAO76_00465 [Georgfuchsia sp.]